MQTRWWSFLESTTNTVISFVQGFLTQLIAFPLFGIHIDAATNVALVCIFLAVSFIRSFLIRRAFNLWSRP